MMDQRLVDYSSQYKDYRETLEEKCKLFTLDDMMSVIKGFVANCRSDSLNSKERELLKNLDELHGSYQNS